MSTPTVALASRSTPALLPTPSAQLALEAPTPHAALDQNIALPDDKPPSDQYCRLFNLSGLHVCTLMPIGEVSVDCKKPAELYPSSNNPKLILMSIPAEIRMQIYRYVLINHDPAAEKSWNTYYRPCTNETRFIWGQERRNATANPTKVLLVCRGMYTEAVEVLYHENVFLSTNLNIVRGIGAFGIDIKINISKLNAFRIRSLVLEMADPAKRARRSVLFMLSIYLTGLQTLRIKTRDQDVVLHHDMSPTVWALDQNRFLRLAAIITQNHRTLRKAVWRHMSGGKIIEHVQHRGFWGFEFCVDLLAETAEPKDPGSTVLKDRHRRNRLTKDIVIDCQKVLSTPRQDFFGRDIEEFAEK